MPLGRDCVTFVTFLQIQFKFPRLGNGSLEKRVHSHGRLPDKLRQGLRLHTSKSTIHKAEKSQNEGVVEKAISLTTSQHHAPAPAKCSSFEPAGTEVGPDAETNSLPQSCDVFAKGKFTIYSS